MYSKVGSSTASVPASRGISPDTSPSSDLFSLSFCLFLTFLSLFFLVRFSLSAAFCFLMAIRLFFPIRFFFAVIVCDVLEIAVAMMHPVDLRMVTRQGISNPGLMNIISSIHTETGVNIPISFSGPATAVHLTRKLYGIVLLAPRLFLP